MEGFDLADLSPALPIGQVDCLILPEAKWWLALVDDDRHKPATVTSLSCFVLNPS